MKLSNCPRTGDIGDGPAEFELGLTVCDFSSSFLSGYTWRTEITSRLWPSKPTKHFFNNQGTKKAAHIDLPYIM